MSKKILATATVVFLFVVSDLCFALTSTNTTNTTVTSGPEVYFNVINQTLNTVYIATQTHEQATCNSFTPSDSDWTAINSTNGVYQFQTGTSASNEEACGRAMIALQGSAGFVIVGSMQFHCLHATLHDESCHMNQSNAVGGNQFTAVDYNPDGHTASAKITSASITSASR